MATVAKNLDFRLGSAATPTTKVDLSAYVTEATLDRSADLPDATVFNSGGAKSYAAGLTDGDLKVEFMWNQTVDAQLKALVGFGTAVDFTLGELGTTTGYPKTTGSCFLSKLGKPQKVGDLMKISADFKTTGQIQDSVY